MIFTDKTGTLTENHMMLRSVSSPSKDFELEENSTCGDETNHSSPALVQLLKASVLCNNASITDENDDQIAEDEQGDPTETALLRAGLKFGIKREDLLAEFSEVREVSFDSDTMMMATVHKHGDEYYIAVKGAPEKVLHSCTTQIIDVGDSDEELNEQEIEEWLQRSEEMANKGLRLLAVADKKVVNSDEEPYSKLRFLGLAGLLDPARGDVKGAISECNTAGIRIIMVTGDQGPTAAAIAYETGISEEKAPNYIHSSEKKRPKRWMILRNKRY